MKKGSTAATKPSRNSSQQKLAIGLNLGDRSSWYCMFGAMPRSRIALETGMHSPWVSRLLSELGHEVIVAHARNVRLIGARLEGKVDFECTWYGKSEHNCGYG